MFVKMFGSCFFNPNTCLYYNLSINHSFIIMSCPCRYEYIFATQ